ncbi:NAD(P)-binding protein [Mycena amicta]|nr:NAD(P)-binding protein [Mycena amicta]
MAPHILILGATGGSGLALIQMAQHQPDPPTLTLYVRPNSRNKLPANIADNARVRVVEGSLTDPQALADAMQGVDTVVSVLGAYIDPRWQPIADSFPTIISVMRASSTAKRLMALSTPSFSGDPNESHSAPLKWRIYRSIPPFFVPQGNAEMVGIAKAVASADDLDWTVFRVPHLTDHGAELPVAAGLIGPDYQASIDLSRKSMAVWILNEIEERKWVKKAPMLANY